MENSPLILGGCTPVPLAHYLKALGSLRLVTEQTPENQVRGAWRNDVFVLEGDFDEASLTHFFLRTYQPTPIMAPWNGGSGFYPSDNREAISALENSTADRLAPYRHAIIAARACVDGLKLTDKPDKEAKEKLLLACRNRLPEEALAWLDCAYVLTDAGAKFPPLLGTGGNDGRLEFTNNFMQRLTEVFDPDGNPTKGSANWLQSALFNKNTDQTAYGAPIGQFFPGGAGGFNSGPGFVGRGMVNPWDYILMMEGAILFAAASVKRLGATGDGTLVYPFCVRQAGVGYGSASASDETDARCEMWMPLWERPANLAELQALLSEGRAQVNGRAARTGVDFMRAAVSLGVDRGIVGFQRYGFQVRNGLAYFATPLDRVTVRRNEKVDLLAHVEKWLDRFRSKAASTNPEPPSSVATSLRVLEDAIFGLCRSDEPAKVQQLLIALGRCEKAMARSSRWSRESAFLKPITGLSTRWLHEAYTDSAEFRLACALATTAGRYGKDWLPLRAHLEPVSGGIGSKTWFNWLDVDSNDVLWHEGSPIDVLNEIFARRLVRAEQSGLNALPDRCQTPVYLADIAAFIEGQIDGRIFDDGLFADLLWGCSLVDYSQPFDPPRRRTVDDGDLRPPAFFALLKLAFAGRLEDGIRIPLQPAIHQRASSGDSLQASELAVRRLRASGLAPAIARAPLSRGMTRRAAAALLFPLGPEQLSALRKTVTRPAL